MKDYLKTVSMLCAFLLAIGCSSLRAQTSAETKILISNDEHYISYRVDQENVILTFELINDFTDQTRGDFPNVDFVSVVVDVDQNSEITENIDTAYGLKGKPTWRKRDWDTEPFVTGLCTQFLITSGSSTVCGRFVSKSSLDFGFYASDKQSAKHPVFVFTIPRAELSADGRSARVRLKIYSAGKGFTTYPAAARGEKYYSFADTLKMNF